MRKMCADARVIMRRGYVSVQMKGLEADLREPFWLLKWNQAIILPGLRRQNRRNIFVGHRKYGYGEYRGGAIPLACKRRREEYWSDYLENRLAEIFGICRRGRRMGYYAIKLKRTLFIVDVHRTEEQGYHCMLYTYHNNDYIGDFTYNAVFTAVYTRLGVRKYKDMFCIIVGYMLCALMNAAIQKLTNTLDVNC